MWGLGAEGLNQKASVILNLQNIKMLITLIDFLK